MATAPSNTAGSTNEMDEFIKKSRVTRAAPPKPAYDPLQFVQIKPAKLYDLNKAKPSTERKLEVKAQREVVVEDAEEWQCNLDNWKSSRRKRVEHIIDKITEAKKIEQEEVCRGRKKSKTFSEMLENSGSRRRFILPGTDDDDEGGSFSDDLQDNQRVSSKEHYKDESTDERTTDDTESCSSSKQTDGESKTPDLIESLDTPEVNEFSLAIENYKSKFPMTQNRSSLLNSGTTTSITTTTITSSNSSSSNLVTMTTLSLHTVEKELSVQKPIVSEAEAQSLFTETADAPSSNESLEEDEGHSEQQTQKEQEVTPKVNIIERRRLFEQFQRLSCISDEAGSALPSSAAPPTRTVKLSGTVGNGQEQQPDRERLCDDAPTTTDEPASSSSDWLAAGATSIKERRAIFERYQSMEGGDEQEQFVGRSRSNSSAVVIKSRSESNVVGGGCKGGTVGQRYELTLEHLKRSSNGADCCEDSGIQSTDLSRSSVVSQADDSEMLQLLSDVGKSPIRSAATLDSASEFSDTECSNGQLIENALDVAFEEMDSELNETSVVTEDACVTVQGNHTSSQQLELPETTELTEECLVPLSVVPCPPDFVAPVEEFNDELVLLSLPKSKLTPPKEKPPPPPVDDEPEADQQPSATATGSVTSWMQQAACSAMHQNGAELYRDSKSNGTNGTLAAGTGQGNGRLEDFQLQEDNFRQLESYEVVQQVQLEQRKRFEEQKDHEREQERQELLVYSNRIETQPHHHSLYEAGEHEEIVSVERELLQIEQEEMQRRRDKQMFYEKLSKGDPPRLSELQPSTQQQQQQHQQQQQQQQQLQTHQQSQHQPHQQKQDPYYHHPHHHHQHHHHHHHNHHHRASMPAIDSRSLQNVNAYGAFETPFLDDVSSYEMGSLHRESMPNLSQVPGAYSSHPSSLSSYGEGYSTNSATSFDGGCAPMNRQSGGPLPDRRPIIAPRPTMNGFVEHHHHQQAATDLSGAGGGFNAADRSRLYSNVFEQHPKDNKQNVYHPGASMNRVSSGGNGATSTTSYGQHWLVQEAEQRRIEQHQKNSAGTKRPLPKFVIDAITQRVQKLNAGGAGSEHSDNLSEDSDLAIINSMKHHHNQPLGTSVPQAHHQQQQYSNTSDKVLSVSGKKECSHCRIELGKGAAMAIESLGLFYHIECFKCCVCHVKLGDGTNGIDVRVRKYRLHCQNCFSSEDGVKFSCV